MRSWDLCLPKMRKTINSAIADTSSSSHRTTLQCYDISQHPGVEIVNRNYLTTSYHLIQHILTRLLIFQMDEITRNNFATLLTVSLHLTTSSRSIYSHYRPFQINAQPCQPWNSLHGLLSPSSAFRSLSRLYRHPVLHSKTLLRYQKTPWLHVNFLHLSQHFRISPLLTR